MGDLYIVVFTFEKIEGEIMVSFLLFCLCFCRFFGNNHMHVCNKEHEFVFKIKQKKCCSVLGVMGNEVTIWKRSLEDQVVPPTPSKPARSRHSGQEPKLLSPASS